MLTGVEEERGAENTYEASSRVGDWILQGLA